MVTGISTPYVRIKENLIHFLGIEINSENTTTQSSEEINSQEIPEEEPIESKIEIISGEPVTESKSKFVAHCGLVRTVEEVEEFRYVLLKNKRIREATHNISAYRLFDPLKGLVEDRDDDGETGAADKVLFMLQRLTAVNVVVVVTRWFGGVLLGPDRFKIITNVAKDLVQLLMNQKRVETMDMKTLEASHQQRVKEKKLAKSNKGKKVKQKFDYILVMDFEATCDDSSQFTPREIIEFPAVLVNVQTHTIEDTFSRFVRPEENPLLTPFCTHLTGITQQDVDQASPLGTVLGEFEQWVRTKGLLERVNKLAILTCGDWDLKEQLPSECLRKGLTVPHWMKKWINIKHPFSYQYRDSSQKKAVGMKGMLNRLNIPLEGRHHSGLDDSKNIAKILIRLLQDNCELTITGSTIE